MKKAVSVKVPFAVLREAWVAGIRAQTNKRVIMERKETPGFMPPTHWRDPEDRPFLGTEYEDGMRAAAEILVKWAKKSK